MIYVSTQIMSWQVWKCGITGPFCIDKVECVSSNFVMDRKHKEEDVFLGTKVS